ncbi:hypothetical protein Ga0080559_TMP1334 [Salipiger profundus]|uniref:Uncharacterized protein n=1 Tax=Salipiger profundus TaxID=1229727 RepID=A0A1U7D237_9RHOB|nr:hypothetical protein Ga0080559_TMP1334 [Salipiger profundus]
MPARRLPAGMRVSRRREGALRGSEPCRAPRVERRDRAHPVRHLPASSQESRTP